MPGPVLEEWPTRKEENQASVVSQKPSKERFQGGDDQLCQMLPIGQGR